MSDPLSESPVVIWSTLGIAVFATIVACLGIAFQYLAWRRTRIKLSAQIALIGDRAEGHRIHVHNLSQNPVIVEDFEIEESTRDGKPVSVANRGWAMDLMGVRIDAHDTWSVCLNEDHWFAYKDGATLEL
ncbi:hypothetical protein [Parvularcula lutaonensis]|uniref:Uncharacterized protein n=1 Tax=Parvularcula lutaonensis TaxID=491923 RepID=A0ABV7MEN9_9PROT|nr:hypothetical protein [Parvularcula lutaonensis]GGY57244.1 hypothetical protein GCM10007148_28390 [Parvularcula lutaonensis]